MRNPVNREIRIFPHVFIRYAAGHHEALEQFCWAEMEGLYNNYNELCSELDLLKELICEYLYEAIQIAVNIEEKKELLNLKRDIFNLRNISDRDWQKFLESLPPEKKLNFSRFMELKTDRTYLNGVWENAYQKQITFHRTLLQIMSSRELLRKGIMLSSSILSEQLKSFISTPATAFRTRELRQEFSLLRYITRMHFKTSPFSTFTCLGLGEVSTITSVVHIPVLSDDLVISKVRLNNEIFNYLKTLITLSPDINELLCIRLNPTIQVEGDNIRLLVNFHNLESFQTLKSSEVLKTILDKEFNGKFLTLKDWITKLEEEVESSYAEIKAYLLKLIDIGLLEFDLQTSGIDPDWDLSLVNYLKSINSQSDLIKETISVIGKQRNYCQIYANLNIEKRGQILSLMHAETSALFEKFRKSIGFSEKEIEKYKQQYANSFVDGSFKKKPFLLSNLTPEKQIYEDSYVNVCGGIDETELKKILMDVDELCGMLQPLDAITVERNRILEFFLSNYGKEERADVLDFYQNYYLLLKKTQNNLKEEKEGLDTDNHDIHYNQIYENWVAHLKELIRPILNPQSKEITLTLDMVNSIIQHFPTDETNQVLSRGMFAQGLVKDGELMVVTNHIFQGSGRAGGRFLHLFDPKVTADLRDYNKSMSSDSILMELTDGSYFNANSHPPLLTHEIKIPDGHNALPLESQIEVKDIQICYDRIINKLFLRHRLTGKRILPFDLCLQSLAQRSKLYQLLANFSPDQAVSFTPIQRAVREILYSDVTDKIEIYHFPRIVFKDNIILKRRGWSVLSSSVPIKTEQQSDADYFRSINLWRKKSDLPNQLFLYLQSRSNTKDNKGGDDYKPQYIRFDTPLLIILFNKLLKKAGQYIYFEEMLPDTEALGKQPVNELLVQWYYKNEA